LFWISVKRIAQSGQMDCAVLLFEGSEIQALSPVGVNRMVLIKRLR